MLFIMHFIPLVWVSLVRSGQCYYPFFTLVSFVNVFFVVVLLSRGPIYVGLYLYGSALRVKQAGRRIWLKHIHISLESDLKKKKSSLRALLEKSLISCFSQCFPKSKSPFPTLPNAQTLLWGISVILLCVLLAMYKELLVSRRE